MADEPREVKGLTADQQRELQEIIGRQAMAMARSQDQIIQSLEAIAFRQRILNLETGEETKIPSHRTAIVIQALRALENLEVVRAKQAEAVAPVEEKKEEVKELRIRLLMDGVREDPRVSQAQIEGMFTARSLPEKGEEE